MMMTSTRSLLLASCVLVLAGCGVDDNGMILVVDHSYVPAVTVTTSDGITTPDGILWWHGKLIMADEGGCALRVWNHGHDVVTLCDRSLGILEPEDLVVDTEGNLFFTDDTAGGLWEVDPLGPGATAKLRVADPMTFASYEHRGKACTRVVISDGPNGAVIHYTCPGGGFGQSTVKALTPRSLRVETQGIADNAPFQYVFQARRVGACG